MVSLFFSSCLSKGHTRRTQRRRRTLWVRINGCPGMFWTELGAQGLCPGRAQRVGHDGCRQHTRRERIVVGHFSSQPEKPQEKQKRKPLKVPFVPRFPSQDNTFVLCSSTVRKMLSRRTTQVDRAATPGPEPIRRGRLQVVSAEGCTAVPANVTTSTGRCEFLPASQDRSSSFTAMGVLTPSMYRGCAGGFPT